jgi:ribonucleoside-diphosphate reductase alpha chain
MGKTMNDFSVIEPGSFSEWIWQEKYRFRDEPDVQATFRRIAKALASAETSSTEHWENCFYETMADFAFLPAGRIIAGAGTGRAVTMSNCFVSPTIGDSLEGIMDAVKAAAMTLKQGGGIGMDFSTLRPRGARVVGVDSVSSGAVSFMRIWDAMCETIMSAGARRGAMMGTLRCDHPDVLEFIEAKRTAGRLTNFNVSVLITDDFMRAVELNESWDLVFGSHVYRSVMARELWDQITSLTYDYAEPGVIFIDRVNDDNPINYCETISASNPCGEQMLPPNGACLLGSLNLARLVENPFTRDARLNDNRILRMMPAIIRMLDNVNDVSNYPMPEQQHEARQKRRIGLGITGLADALIMMGMRYGSQEAVQWLDWKLRTIRRAADAASERLGEQKGSFPLFDRNRFPGSPPARRNSHVMSIAPTGTISSLAGYVSGGIEPVFDFSHKRNVLMRDGTKQQFVVEDYAHRLAKQMGVPTSGDAWVTANDLTVDEHLAMQAAAQKHIDSAISKTINCPQDITLEAFRGVYTKAHKLGLKGCTTFRLNPDSGRGEVLVRIDDKPAKADAAAVSTTTGNVVQIGEPLRRDEVLDGKTYKISPGGGLEHGIYVTINDTHLHGRQVPFEIFINSKAVDSHQWIVALTRMISANWRKGGDNAFIAEELKQVFDPRGGFWSQGEHVPSIVAGIGRIIERHMLDSGAIDSSAAPVPVVGKRHCPKCQTGALTMREGCLVCESCDYSKCG